MGTLLKCNIDIETERQNIARIAQAALRKLSGCQDDHDDPDYHDDDDHVDQDV